MTRCVMCRKRIWRKRHAWKVTTWMEPVARLACSQSCARTVMQLTPMPPAGVSTGGWIAGCEGPAA